MLSALLHSLEPGRICDIVPVGQEFEVHANFTWITVPDDTTCSDRYNEDGTISKWDPLTQPGFAESAYRVAREIEYGSLGNQLDMLYKEIVATGTISNTGPWATHISTVKASIPKDDPAAVLEWNRQKLAETIAMQANAAPI